MKTKILLFAAILLQTTFLFGQKEQSSFYTTVPENCKQTLKEVINGFNNFKSCSQRAEMNKLLTKSRTVINECPAYFAENQNEYNKAKKYVEDTYERLKCTNTNGNTAQQTNSQNGGSSTNPNAPFFENQYNFEQANGQTSGKEQSKIQTSIEVLNAAKPLASAIDDAIAANKQRKESKRLELEKQKIKEEQQMQQTVIEMQPLLTDKPIRNDVTVQSILDKYFAAIGGLSNVESIKFVTQYEEGIDRSAKKITGYGKFFYNEISKGGKNNSKVVFNGTVGYRSYNGKKEGFTKDEIESQKKIQPFYLLGLDWTAAKLGYIETINGNDCYTIIFPTRQMGFENVTRTFYFDVNSGLWCGWKQVNISSSYNYTSYEYYDDYRTVEGVLFPFKRVYFSPNNLNSLNRTYIKEIKINEPLTENDFN